MWSLRAPRDFPRGNYDAAWRDIAFWDEHSWGADKSVDEPDLPIVKKEWEFKQKFAVDAAKSAEELLARAAATTADPERTIFDVYNLSSWARTDLVLLDAKKTAGDDGVVDDEEHPVPSQRMSTGELAVLVENVPPLGAKRLLVGKGAAFQRGSAVATGDSLENENISLHVSGQNGAIDSVRWKNKNISLVDDHAGKGWGEYLYIPGTDPAKAQRLSNVRVCVKENGPLVVSLVIELVSLWGRENIRAKYGWWRELTAWTFLRHWTKCGARKGECALRVSISRAGRADEIRRG